MRRVSYASVLSRLASYLQEADGLTVEDQALLGTKINLFVRIGWEAFWHPDTMTVEKRTFRAAYSAVTAYAGPTSAAGVEVYFPGDGNYYQTLQGTVGNPPATPGPGSDWTVDAVHWCVSAGVYGGDDWATGVSYNLGDQVRNPADNRFYACFAAHVSGGAFDATKFGVLTPFVRSLDYNQALTADGAAAQPFGLVRYIWEKDPTITEWGRSLPRRQEFWLRQNFVQVKGWANVVWVEFQLQAPSFAGPVRSDTAAYPVVGTEVYDSATGDYWVSTAAVNAGESPTSTPAKWSRVPFPYYLAEYVAQSAYALLTNREQQEPESFSVELTAGYPLLVSEMDKVERMQGQTRQLRVVLGRR